MTDVSIKLPILSATLCNFILMVMHPLVMLLCSLGRKTFLWKHRETGEIYLQAIVLLLQGTSKHVYQNSPLRLYSILKQPTGSCLMTEEIKNLLPYRLNSLFC